MTNTNERAHSPDPFPHDDPEHIGATTTQWQAWANNPEPPATPRERLARRLITARWAAAAGLVLTAGIIGLLDLGPTAALLAALATIAYRRTRP